MKALEHIHDIGNMDETFDILRPFVTYNDYGEEIIEYRLHAQIFGDFSFRDNGSESIDSAQITPSHTADLTIRYFPDINEKWRIVRRADMTDWNIDRITDIGRRRFHRLSLNASTTQQLNPLNN